MVAPEGESVPSEKAPLDAFQTAAREVRDRLRAELTAESSAFSTDGRTFEFETSVARPLPVGGYVRLDTTDGRAYLGQVTEEQLRRRQGPQVRLDAAPSAAAAIAATATVDVELRSMAGSGVLLSGVDQGACKPVEAHATFEQAEAAPAEPGLVADYVRDSTGSGAHLEFGEALLGGGGVPALLRAKGFNRHTFLCGQSGSGKTYTLGVILERLLLETELPLVILDPNSDYVGLGQIRPQHDLGLRDDEYDALSRAYSEVAHDRAVFGSGADAEPLQVVFGRLTRRQQAMILGLDPIRDAEDYFAFRVAVDDFGSSDYTLKDLLAHQVATLDEAALRLARRISNLGVADWEVWTTPEEAHVGPRFTQEPQPRVSVFDLGRLGSPEERSVLAAAALGVLWDRRYQRRPQLLVIDEAHNVCPQEPASPHQALATEHAIRIAAEGRKFGLYLLLSTQEPDKVHRYVLSQCDNLLLMRMNSARALEQLSSVFSFVPPELLAQAAQFGLGEGLVAGRIASHPMLFKSGLRHTREGGADIPTSWAAT